MKCPNCNADLVARNLQSLSGYGCSTKGYKCTFFIGKEKFDKLVQDLYTSKKIVVDDDMQENLSALSDL